MSCQIEPIGYFLIIQEKSYWLANSVTVNDIKTCDCQWLTQFEILQNLFFAKMKYLIITNQVPQRLSACQRDELEGKLPFITKGDRCK